MKHSLPKGHLWILDHAFKYTPSGDTDLQRTFKRIRAEREAIKQKEAAELAAAAMAHRPILITRSKHGR